MTMMLLIKFYFQKTELNEDIICMASLLLSHTHHTHSDRSIMLVITLTLRIEIFALINCWISISISIVILYGVSFGLNFFFHFVSSSFSSFFYFGFRSLSCISRFLSLCVSWDTFFNRISWQLKHKRTHTFTTGARFTQANSLINHEFYYQFMDSCSFHSIECLFYCNLKSNWSIWFQTNAFKPIALWRNQ